MPRNKYIVSFIAILLFAPSARPDEESFAERRYAVRVERTLWEGRATISVTAYRLGEDEINVVVNVKHVMYRPKGGAILDDLYFLDHGVKVRAEVSGESVLNPKEDNGDGGSMQKVTLQSESKVSFDVLLKPSDGPRDLQTTVRVAMTIFEPEGSSRPFTLSIPLKKLKYSECKESLSADKEINDLIEQLEKGREEFRRKLQMAWELKDELETAMMRCEDELDNAVYYLDAGKSIEEAFDNAFKEAKYFEDICGLAELAIGVGKAGIKMLTKHSETVLKALRGKPKHFVGFKRVLSAFGEETTSAIAKAAKELDDLRVTAAKDVIEEMTKGANLKAGMKKLEEGESVLIGSAHKRLTTDVPNPEGWKGLNSDIDIEFASKELADHFQAEFTKRVNTLLDARGFGKVGEAGELSVNTFVGNLANFDVKNPAEFEQWMKRLLGSDYLANSDAYRTVGAQKSALYYGNKEVVMDPIDGFEILKENCSRAEIFWKTKNYLDPKVFKDVRKCYERALVGNAIRKSKDPVKLNKNIGELEKFVNNAKHEDDLFERANRIGQNAFDRDLAEEMLQKLRAMDESITEAPSVASKLRRDASDISMACLRADREGGVAGIPLLSGLSSADEAIKEASRQRAREIRISEWIAWAANDTRSAIWTAAGLVEEIIGNPLTAVVKGWGKLFAWDSPPEQELKSARDSVAKAVEALVDSAARGDAERYWTQLCKAVDGLPPKELDALQKRLDEAINKIYAKKRPSTDCFELVAGASLNTMADDYGEIVRFVKRIKYIQATFTKAEALRLAKEDLKFDEVTATYTAAKKEYDPLNWMVEGPATLEEKAEREVRNLQERQLNLSREMEDEEDPKTKKEQEEIRQGWEKVKKMREEATALRRQAAEQGERIKLAKVAFHTAAEEKKLVDDAVATLEATWPSDLRFRSIAQALLDRGLENQNGKFSALALKGYCAEMRMTIRAIRCGDADISSRPQRR